MAVVAQEADRFGRRFGFSRQALRFLLRPRAQFPDHAGEPLRMAMDPGRKPAADITPAGYRGEVVEFFQHAAARQRPQHAEPERRAAYAPARKTKRAAYPIRSVQVADFPVQRRQTGCIDAGNGVLREHRFKQNAVQLNLLVVRNLIRSGQFRLRRDGYGGIGLECSCLRAPAAARMQPGQLRGRAVALQQGVVVEVFRLQEQFIEFEQQQLLELLRPCPVVQVARIGKQLVADGADGPAVVTQERGIEVFPQFPAADVRFLEQPVGRLRQRAVRRDEFLLKDFAQPQRKSLEQPGRRFIRFHIPLPVFYRSPATPQCSG